MNEFAIASGDFVNGCTVDWLRLSIHYRLYTAVAEWLGIPAGDKWEPKSRFNKVAGVGLMDGVGVYADHMPTLINEDDPSAGYQLVGLGADERFIVDWSGSGLGHWAKEKGATPLDLLRKARELAESSNLIRVQRLDVAFDDYDGLLDMDKIERYLRRTNLVVTRWESFERTSSSKIRGQSEEEPEDGGETIYLGSRLSNSFARIYDKLKEVKAKLNRKARRAVAKEDALPPRWIRFELELKRQHAQAVADGMLDAEDVTTYVLGVLRGKIDFKATSGDKRIRRRAAVRWWQQFTDSCAAIPIRVPRPALTLERIRAWLDRSVAQSLAVVWLAAGGEEGAGDRVIKGIAQDGAGRLDKKKEGLLRQQAMAHGL